MADMHQQTPNNTHYFKNYPLQCSNHKLLSIMNARIREENICQSIFFDEAFSRFPYCFQKEERYSFIVEEEKKLLDQVLRYKYRQFITIKKVQNFESKQIKEFWMVDANKMVIIGRMKRSPSPIQIQEMIQNYFKNPQVYPKPMKQLYFGRSTGLGKVVQFDTHDVSRTHCKIKFAKNFQTNLRSKATVLLCFKNALRSSKWAKLTYELRKNIMDYIFDINYNPFQIQDLKSKVGTYLNLGNHIELHPNLPSLALTERGEIEIKIQKIMVQDISQAHKFDAHLGKVNEIIADIPTKSDYPICIRPSYWQDYYLVKEQLKSKTKNEKGPLNVSTIFFKITIVNQIRYFILNNCSTSYKMTNGIGDLQLINPYSPKKQLITIYFEDGKWKAEGADDGFDTRLSTSIGFGLHQSSMIRMGKNTKIIIDLPHYF